MTAAEAFYNGARAYKRELTGEKLAGLTEADMDALRSATERRWTRKATAMLPEARLPSVALLTAPVALEIISHEAIVREAYKDSVGVWTWGIGVTNASGHIVHPRYKDNPQPVERCIEVFLWLLKAKYIPALVQAFDGFMLTEAQFAAALSFHYNTGAIGRADWVKHFRDGRLDLAKAAIMNWLKPPEIATRRTKERDLFFEGKWATDGKATVYPVKKPSYTPDWGKAERVDVRSMIEGLLA